MEMWQASLESAVKNRIFIGCAAVADYRVAEVADQKLRKPMITMSFLLNW